MKAYGINTKPVKYACCDAVGGYSCHPRKHPRRAQDHRRARVWAKRARRNGRKDVWHGLKEYGLE